LTHQRQRFRRRSWNVTTMPRSTRSAMEGGSSPSPSPFQGVDDVRSVRLEERFFPNIEDGPRRVRVVQTGDPGPTVPRPPRTACRASGHASQVRCVSGFRSGSLATRTVRGRPQASGPSQFQGSARARFQAFDSLRLRPGRPAPAEPARINRGEPRGIEPAPRGRGGWPRRSRASVWLPPRAPVFQVTRIIPPPRVCAALRRPIHVVQAARGAGPGRSANDRAGHPGQGGFQSAVELVSTQRIGPPMSRGRSLPGQFPPVVRGSIPAMLSTANRSSPPDGDSESHRPPFPTPSILIVTSCPILGAGAEPSVRIGPLIEKRAVDGPGTRLGVLESRLSFSPAGQYSQIENK